MKRLVLVVGTFAAMASLASTDLRTQPRTARTAAIATPAAPPVAVHAIPACDGALRTQLALAAIATAP